MAIAAASHKVASLLGKQPTYLAIIGTAGRNEDACKMNATVFVRMLDHAAYVQRSVWKLSNERVILVSGGSAWADHVAVKLFLREAMDPDGSPYAGLRLFLPCDLKLTGGGHARAADSGSSDWRCNPGRLLNQLHASFDHAMGSDTWNELALAHSFGAQLCFDGRGFHQRNKLVAAQADRLLAFTWGTDPLQPKDGGTMQTWKLANAAVKLHVPLAALMSSPAIRQVVPESSSSIASRQLTSDSLAVRRSSATATVDKSMVMRKSAEAFPDDVSSSSTQGCSVITKSAAAWSSPKKQRTNEVFARPFAPALPPASSPTCTEHSDAEQEHPAAAKPTLNSVTSSRIERSVRVCISSSIDCFSKEQVVASAVHVPHCFLLHSHRLCCHQIVSSASVALLATPSARLVANAQKFRGLFLLMIFMLVNCLIILIFLLR